MTDTIKDAIRTILNESQRLDRDDFDGALDAVSDDLSTGEREDDLYLDSVLDGIRWGCRAAVVVELGGSTILRLRAPGGVGITHEWLGNPHSAIARASIMATVKEAMGETGKSKLVHQVWDEAASHVADMCAGHVDQQAELYEDEAHDQRQWGNGEASKSAKVVAHTLRNMAASIRNLKPAPSEGSPNHD